MSGSKEGRRTTGVGFFLSRVASAMVAALVISLTVGVAVTSAPQSAQAAQTAASFDAGDLISDTVFYDGNGTSQATVQNVLNTYGASCRAAGSLACLKNITIATPAEAATSYCSAIAATSSENAAQLFVTIGKACSINPSVLVVLVEKEESLVTRTSPSVAAYEHATGFNCPDSAPCSGPTGLFEQTYLASAQFQHYKASPKSFNYQPFKTNSILYHPASSPSCGSSKVYIEDYATAGLYDYTPYQPDAAALANMYGTGDACSSYGNRNFWRIYSDWFGSTGNLLRSSSFESSTSGWGFGDTTLGRQLVDNPANAQSGNDYLAVSSSVMNRAFGQVVTRSAPAGSAYQASVWVKSGSATATFSGKLEISTTGGSGESSVAPFTVGSTWTQVTTELDLANAGHTAVELSVLLDTPGISLDVDTTNLSPVPWQSPGETVAISSPSFEQGLGTWTFKNGFANRAVYTQPQNAENGSRYLATSTSAAGRSVGQDVAHNAIVGETYTLTIWMKSGKAGLANSGKLALWALGGSSEVATTPFDVGSAWTPVVVTLPITKSGHNDLRIEVYLGTLGYDLDLDNVSLASNLLPNGSFEKGASNLTAAVGAPAITTATNSSSAIGLIAGTQFAQFKAAAAGDTVSFAPVNRRLLAGQTYTATVWMRTDSVGSSASVTLALSAIGGTTQTVTTAVPALSSAWTPVQVTLTTADASNDQLRIDVTSSTPGVEIDMDNAQLQ